jgi:hypothetical protein
VGSDRASFAARTAAAALSRPSERTFPCSAGILSAVVVTISLIAEVLSSKFTASIKATTPATCGVACEVPERRPYPR